MYHSGPNVSGAPAQELEPVLCLGINQAHPRVFDSEILCSLKYSVYLFFYLNLSLVATKDGLLLLGFLLSVIRETFLSQRFRASLSVPVTVQGQQPPWSSIPQCNAQVHLSHTKQGTAYFSVIFPILPTEEQQMNGG